MAIESSQVRAAAALNQSHTKILKPLQAIPMRHGKIQSIIDRSQKQA